MGHGIPLIAIPNISEGRDPGKITRLVGGVAEMGVRVLDVHSDPRHDRTVITVVGEPDRLTDGMVALASQAAQKIDLESSRGVHPRVGALDVCPFVPWDADMSVAVQTARTTADRIAEEVSLPVYLYGEASLRGGETDLPRLRRGGLEGLKLRAASDLPPDAGPSLPISSRTGVVCIGARGPLIAFNVWFVGPLSVARQIASEVRSSKGGALSSGPQGKSGALSSGPQGKSGALSSGPQSRGGREGIRALGLDMGGGLIQVSMNLVSPDLTGIDLAFSDVARAASGHGLEPVRTELVGLPFERHMPDPEMQAARLMFPPGRSLESVLEEQSSSG